MSSSISLKSAKSNAASSPWWNVGLLSNPFPASGVPTDVDYDDHQLETVQQIVAWLERSVDPASSQWSPLAISGSIGVGKTHVLRKMERALRDHREAEKLDARLMISSHTLVEAGMKTLLLSNLLMDGLNQPLPSGNVQMNSAEMPLLATAVEQMLLRRRTAVVEELPHSSPIQKPLTRIAASRTTQEAMKLTSLLSAWLARRNLTRDQLGSLGLGGRLESEGQAVRAFAHVCKFARLAMDFQVWFVFIDQMEDLWRRDVTTPLRRTRFLTDLRTLIDEALEGSPIALTLAWNTEVVIGGARVEEDVEARLKRDYLAMFSRVSNVIHISTLPQEHLLPFANAYVDFGHSRFLADRVASRTREAANIDAFKRAMQKEFLDIRSRVASWGIRANDNSVVARAWLDALRNWAEDHSAPS